MSIFIDSSTIINENEGEQVQNTTMDRMRVSNIVTQFDAQFQYNKQDLLWGESGNNGGGINIHLPNESSVQMSTGDGNDGSRARRRTNIWFRYQLGIINIIEQAFVFAAGKENLKQQVGIYDDDNGILLQLDNTIAKLILKSNTVGNITIEQQNWNADKLNGTGESGISIDWTKAQLMRIELQWRGVGSIKIYFQIEDRYILANTIHNVNMRDSVYMTTANLPLTYEIFNGGFVAGASNMKQLSSTIYSEGGTDANNLKGDLRAVDSGDDFIPTTNTEKAILAIRPKLTFNGITNRGQIWPYDIKFHVADNEECRFIIYIGAQVPDGEWNSVGDDSIAEFNNNMTSFTPGLPLVQEFVLENRSELSQIAEEFLRSPLVLNEDGTTQTILLITSKNLTGGTASSRCSIKWKEQK